jgi:hypothetical protein
MDIYAWHHREYYPDGEISFITATKPEFGWASKNVTPGGHGKGRKKIIAHYKFLDLVHLFTVLHLFMLWDAVLVARAAPNRLGT